MIVDNPNENFCKVGERAKISEVSTLVYVCESHLVSPWIWVLPRVAAHLVLRWRRVAHHLLRVVPRVIRLLRRRHSHLQKHFLLCKVLLLGCIALARRLLLLYLVLHLILLDFLHKHYLLLFRKLRLTGCLGLAHHLVLLLIGVVLGYQVGLRDRSFRLLSCTRLELMLPGHDLLLLHA